MAEISKSGSLAATGSSEACQVDRPFYLVLSGTWTGTVVLEASLDGGATWVAFSKPDLSATSWTTNICAPILAAYGRDVLFRVTFTRTGGTLNWRIIR